MTGVRLRGAPNSGFIDVVFVPERSYSESMAAFESAVIDNIANWYLRLDEMTIDPLPADYKDRFNFYRYTGGFGTQTGCSGGLPGNFWSDAPGADVGAILAAPGSGAWGCTNSLGPPGGHIRFIALGNRGDLVTHESGHGIFGLVDEYCGCTYYTENSPTTNVWDTLAGCQNAAASQGWTTGNCREISCTPTCDGTPTTVQGWWRYDPDAPDDDFMTCCPHLPPYQFGEACSWRMNWAFGFPPPVWYAICTPKPTGAVGADGITPPWRTCRGSLPKEWIKCRKTKENRCGSWPIPTAGWIRVPAVPWPP